METHRFWQRYFPAQTLRGSTTYKDNGSMEECETRVTQIQTVSVSLVAYITLCWLRRQTLAIVDTQPPVAWTRQLPHPRDPCSSYTRHKQ